MPVSESVHDRPVLVLETPEAAEKAPVDRAITPTGTKLFEISEETRCGLPATAKDAYQRAARWIEQTRPGCALPWTLLAGVGRVEFDHGRYGGSRLGVDGVSRPPIRASR